MGQHDPVLCPGTAELLPKTQRIPRHLACGNQYPVGDYRRQFHPDVFWKGRKEVDFVWKMRDGRFCGLNVCYTDDISARETAALDEFAAAFGDAVTKRYMLTKNRDTEENGIIYVPVWKWLLELD